MVSFAELTPEISTPVPLLWLELVVATAPQSHEDPKCFETSEETVLLRALHTESEFPFKF